MIKSFLATSFARSYGWLHRSTVLQVLFSESSSIRNVVFGRGQHNVNFMRQKSKLPEKMAVLIKKLHKSKSSYRQLPYYRRRFSSQPCKNGRPFPPWFWVFHFLLFQLRGRIVNSSWKWYSKIKPPNSVKYSHFLQNFWIS